MDLFLSLDQGSSSSRAIIFDKSGRQLVFSQCPVKTYSPQPGLFEQDGVELVESLQQVAREAVEQLNVEQQSKLQCAGLVSQRSSVICWRKSSGEVLSPVISWRDRRAADWLASKELSVSDIHQRTGLFPSPHYSASKMYWCLENTPSVKQAASENDLIMAPLAAYLIYALLNENPLFIDPANAGRSLLMNINSLDWDDELLANFSVRKSFLPTIKPTNARFGTLAVGQLYLPLSYLNGDQSAAVYANGTPEKTSVYCNIGTGGFMYRVAGNQTVSRLLSSISHWSVDNDKEGIVEGTVNGAGAAIDWARKQFSHIDVDALLHSDDFNPPETLFFINGVGGVGSPFWLADVDSYFVGDGTDQQKIIAVVESIVFLLIENLHCLQTVSPQLEKIVLSGGVSKNNYVCQCLSDLAQLPVLRSDDAEASARGAVYNMTGRNQQWLLPQSNDTFLPKTNRGLEQRYQLWQSEMQVLVKNCSN